MFEWVLFLSQLGLWVMVIQLYRSRAQDRQSMQISAEQKAQEASLEGSASTDPLTVEFDFLDNEAVSRMATIRTLLGEIEGRAQRLSSNEFSGGLSTPTPPIPPVPSSVEEREELTAFLAPPRRSLEAKAVPSEPQRSLAPDLVATVAYLESGRAWGSSPAVRLDAPAVHGGGQAPALPDESTGSEIRDRAHESERNAVAEVRSLASSGLDAPSIARSTGRQLEEVNLLLHLAHRSGPLTDQGVRGAQGPLTERRRA